MFTMLCIFEEIRTSVANGIYNSSPLLTVYNVRTFLIFLYFICIADLSRLNTFFLYNKQKHTHTQICMYPVTHTKRSSYYLILCCSCYHSVFAVVLLFDSLKTMHVRVILSIEYDLTLGICQRLDINVDLDWIVQKICWS